MIEQLDALIFDVDGTLAETEEAHRLSFNDAFAEAGLAWVWSQALYGDLLKVTGGKERIRYFLDREAVLLPGDPEPLIGRLHVRKTEIYTRRVTAGEVAFRPGMTELIHEARRRGVPLGIATTTSRPNVEALVTACLGEQAMDWFAAVICGDMVPRKKPAPDVYLAALETLGVPASHAVAVEDSENGIRSARGAGLAVIVTPSRYCAADDFSDATWLIADSADIASVLRWG
jgi:HAD superfamily hydrolase (TIGR01509 family)